MKKYANKLFGWAGIAAGIAVIAGLTSLITAKRTVWITLKRNEKDIW